IEHRMPAMATRFLRGTSSKSFLRLAGGSGSPQTRVYATEADWLSRQPSGGASDACWSNARQPLWSHLDPLPHSLMSAYCGALFLKGICVGSCLRAFAKEEVSE